MKTLYDFSYDQMVDLMIEMGFKKYRGEQLFDWLYRKRVTSFEDMTNLDKPMREVLEKNYVLSCLSLKDKQVSRDGTTKYLFELQDGSLIETVLMHFEFGESLCVTSQVGCNMGCTFCASGLLKKQRDLTSGEIVEQVMKVQKELDEQGQRISNIVIMGTGEPFDNYEAVMNFCRTVNHDKGLAIGARHLTISTCGLVPMIERFSKEHVQYNLAISLHAPNDDLRSKLMPINRKYPLALLMKTLKAYSEENNRRLTFEYILLKDVNDSDTHAKQLANLVRGMNAYVNLIPYNAVDENGYQGVKDREALHFYDVLMKQGVKATLRAKHGDDIDAACGQLRAKHERNKAE